MTRIQEAIRERDDWFTNQWKRILREADDESNLMKHARSELQAAGHFDDDGFYGGALGKAVLELIKSFCDQGHSGMSAHFAMALFDRLARYLPLTPLTGEDDEWNEVGDQNGGPLYQNRRCGHIFKDPNGAYNIEGIVWKDRDGGATYTNRDSHVPITFPYTVPDKPELRWADTKELVQPTKR